MRSAVYLLLLTLLCGPLAAQKESSSCGPWFTGTLVAASTFEPGDPPILRFERPGAPSIVSCTDDFDPDWCLDLQCGPSLSPGSEACLSAAITDCHSVVVSGGVISYLAPVASGECPAPL